MSSHTRINQVIQSNGEGKQLSLPSLSINYNSKFSPKWAVGLHNDIVLEDFAIEEHLKSSEGKILERSYPIAAAIMASYKPGKHFSFIVGAGVNLPIPEIYFW